MKENNYDFAAADDQLFGVKNYYWSADENLDSGNYTVELWNMETSFWNELNYGYFYGMYVKFIEQEITRRSTIEPGTLHTSLF